MNHKKVSIIVPIYNVEKYIEECVRSLCCQTYENVEILLIDDGSKDSSPQICDSLAELDDRIRVVHKTNGGAASARNTGIYVATGEYVCFVDADDLIDREYVHKLLSAMEQSCADISVCGLFYLTKKQCKKVECEPSGIYSNIEYLKEFLNSWSCSLMTNKLFKKSTIGSIRFEEGHCIDDEFFTYLVVMNAHKVTVIDDSLYYYRMRASSVMQDMNSNLERIMLDRIEYITTRLKNVSEKIPSLKNEFFMDAVDTLVRYKIHSMNMPHAQKAILEWAKLYRRDILKIEVSWKQKIVMLYNLHIKKPVVCAEINPIQFDMDEYFL